jgi:hypothetical protein
MVVSPPYPCQLVFVAKLIAVLNDESGETAPNPMGLSGNRFCNLWIPYTANKPARLNNKKATA